MNRYFPVWLAGGAIALVAVLAGAFLITDPPVYGFCVACHGRDLVGGTLNLAFGFRLPVSFAAQGWPVLTVVGLLIGAHLGASSSGEHRQRAAVRPARSFLLGMGAMIFSLVALGCTVRLLLRAAYGDPLAYWALAGAAVGIAGATGLLALRARRWSA